MFTILISIFVGILTIALSKWKQVNYKVLEKYSEIEKKTMGRFKRFSEIIKAFELVNGKKPSPNELHAFYDEFHDLETYTSDDVVVVLKDKSKYHQILADFLKSNHVETDVDSKVTPEKMTTESNQIKDEIDDEMAAKLVSKIYKKIFSDEVLSNDNKEFLLYKFRKMNNDVHNLEMYLTSDEEYKSFIKKKIDGQFARDSAAPGDSKLIPSSMSFKISRPHLNNTTVEETKNVPTVAGYTCEDLEDEHVLSKIITSRNMDLLKYACIRSKNKQSNTDNDMVLIKGLDWTIPQERPGVCRSSKPQDPVQYSTDQTSLIGTLLLDSENTKVGSIMPEFEYKEE